MRGNGRVVSGTLVSAGVCSAVALAAVSAVAGPASAGTASSTRSSTDSRAGGSVPVIIFLKNQVTDTVSGTRQEQRSALIQAAQAPYRGQLQAFGATDVYGYRLVNAMSARVPATALTAIAQSPGVASVIPDGRIVGPVPAIAQPGAPRSGAAAVRTPPGACSATPQLSPEGLSLTGTDSSAPGVTTARSLGFTGAGVKVALLADGIDPANANLTRGGKPVIGDYKDFSGDGTSAPTEGGEAFLDANAIAGQGQQAYDVAGFGAQSPASPCRIRIEGAAPGASLVALKVFSHANTSTTSGFLEAIDYAVNVDHVNVINESFGSNPFPDVTSLDAVKEFNDMAVRAGTTVVVASGDAGPFNTIGSPASDPNVISVGASTDFQFYAQTNYAGADAFAKGGWESDNISSLSSGGFTQDGRTLDLVAPGDLSFASCTANPALYSSCVNFLGKASPVEESGGTSQSSPFVAGAAALVIQAYTKAHHGARPTPAVVKQALLSTATDLGAPATEQGTGLLNSLKAVELAAWTSCATPATSTLRLSANQLNDAGKPGTTVTRPLTVTNTSAATQTVAVSGRGFGPSAVVKQATVTLSDAKSPHFTNWAGVASNYGTATFTVPRGAALLNASIAWPTSASSTANLKARVRVILVDPAGRLAAHSLPQGVGGYGNAQVLHPASGRWTAVIFSDSGQAGGTTGAVRFGASVASAVTFGTESPSSLTLAPGASGTVNVSARVPAGAGDSSGSVLFASGGSAVSVPVTLRGLVQAGEGTTGTFSGVLTGGNGRAPGEGQVATYSFVVPSKPGAALRDVDADVTLANDPGNQVSGYLVAPDGETMGYGSSYLTTGFNRAGVPVESPRRQLSVYAADPSPGVWTLVIDFTEPVPGDELADPFTGRVRFNAVSASRGALPASSSVVLRRGRPVTYRVSVRNTGAAPEDVFLDPRLTAMQTYPLQPQDRVAGVKLPVPASQNPLEWIVPTMTTGVSVSATSSVPVTFDFGPFPGDPDEAGSSGLTATAAYPLAAEDTPVTPGLWFASPSEVGPYTTSGATAATVTTVMTAVTQGFDTAANPANGDFWRFAAEPLAASASYSLLVINPGQTATIALTVTPSAPSGSVVHSVLYVDDFVDSLQFLSGSQLAAIPYTYTVK